MQDSKSIDAYQLIGRMIVYSNLLDNKLNDFLMSVLFIPNPPLTKPVIATIDLTRKVEILKSYAKFFHNDRLKIVLNSYNNNIENVIKYRNMVAHSVVVKDGNSLAFSTIAFSKIFKSIDRSNYGRKLTKISEIEIAIKKAEATLSHGREILKIREEFRSDACR